ALSLVLLVGALLFAGSLQKLLAVDPGFRPDGILAVDLDVRAPHYAKERLPVVREDLLRRLAVVPGVSSAASVGFTPISGSGWDEGVQPEGSTAGYKDSRFNRIGPGYLRTMGTQLLGGR